MSTVATNLVATMIQNNFSGNTKSIANQSTTKKVFQDYLSQSKDSFQSREPVPTRIQSSSDKEATPKRVDKPRIIEKTSRDEQDSQKDSAIKKVKQDVEKGKDVQRSESDDVNKLKKSNPLETSDVNDLEENVERLLQEYAEVLGISMEQLKQLLQNMNLEVQDLLNPEVAKEIVMEMNHLETSVDLITNEKAMEQLRDLNQMVKEVPEEMKNFIHSLKIEETNQTKTNVDGIGRGEATQETNGESVVIKQTMDGQKQSSGDAMMQEEHANKTVSSKSESSQGQDNHNNRMNFENALNHVVTQKTETIVMNNTVQTVVTNISAKDVFDQIVDGMKVAVTDSKTTMTLQLQPENLGKIALNLTSEHGTLTGHFVAESEVVKEAIEANLSQLKTQLQQQGLNINEIKITVGDSQAFFAGKEQQESDQQSMFKKQSKSSLKVSRMNGDVEEEDETDNHTEMMDASSSVEFSA